MTTDKEKLDAALNVVNFVQSHPRQSAPSIEEYNEAQEIIEQAARKWQLLCEIPSNEDVDLYTRDQAAELIQSIEEQTNNDR